MNPKRAGWAGLAVLAGLAFTLPSQQFSTLHCDISYTREDAPFVVEIARSAERAYSNWVQGWGRDLPGRLQIVVYPSSLELAESAGTTAGRLRGDPYTDSSGVVHFISPRDGWRSRTILYESTLPHEIGHAFINRIVPGGSQIPRWFAEGLADSILPVKSIARPEDLVRDAALSRALPDITGGKAQSERLFYAASTSFVGALKSSGGDALFRSFLARLESGKSFDSAFAETYQKSPADAYFQWINNASEGYLKKLAGFPLIPAARPIYNKNPVLSFATAANGLILNLPRGNDLYYLDTLRDYLLNLTNTPEDYEVDPDYRNGLLVFSSSRRDENFDLWESNLKGEQVRPLVISDGGEFSPLINPLHPDQIVFTGAETGNSDLYLRKGSDTIQLTRSPDDDINPAWNSSGDAVYSLHRTDSTSEAYRLDLNTYALSTVPFKGYVKRLAPNPSTDGIAFIGETKSGDDLYLYNWTTGALRRLTSDGARKEEVEWSRSGKTFAFNEEVAGQLDIFLYRLSDDVAQRLISSAYDEINLKWDAKGNLYFLSGESWNRAVYRLSPVGGK